MKKVYITFGGKAYDRTTALIVERGPQMGADEVRVYDDAWLIQTKFYQRNKWMFDLEPRQCWGCCCWKPFIIFHAMRSLDMGDMVLYTDADTYPVHDFSVLFRECDREGIFLFAESGCDNRRWVKHDCYLAMGQMPEHGKSGVHACGRFQVFKKGAYLSDALLMEWFTYSQNPLCQTTLKSQYGHEHVCPERAVSFHEHRNEQAILSLLASSYNIPLHRVACQFGVGQPEDQDLYPQLFEQEWCEGDRNDMSGSRFRNI